MCCHFLILYEKKKLFKNYEKCFLLHLKSSFRSRDIQFFVIFPLLSTDTKGEIKLEQL